ncbi:MAG: DUF5675 family protein, partial [Candidatus Saccharicenans sp.]|nr:DUF5675 family protein [Candidatus Saccharicenans sp.]
GHKNAHSASEAENQFLIFSTEAVKTFSLPEGAPFIISQNKFQVVERISLREGIQREFRVEREKENRDESWIWRYRESEPSLIEKIKAVNLRTIDGLKKESGGSGELRTMSVGEIGIYYIYSFDGRLLAEYDGYGVCLREYIYVGAKMVAEYQPATGKYYYYTTDQINSTRVVTDDNGNVVYAAMHDPYGGVHHTWANAFNPELKFSGKEQDTESGLYYFGARYYDPTLYRFLSPDPVIPTGPALYNPQRWNLYGYCLGNPICFVDPKGQNATYYFYLYRFKYSNNGTFGIYYLEGNGRIIDSGFTLEPGLNQGKGPIPPGTYPAKIIWWDRKEPKRDYYVWKLMDVPNRSGILIHAGNNQSHTSGCILTGGGLYPSENSISGSRIATDNLVMGPIFEEIFPGAVALEEMSLTVHVYDNDDGFVVDKPGYVIICTWYPSYII